MDSEQSAYVTAQQKHHRYMIFGKKQRYIEVFQCSGEDMNLVLTGGIPAPVPSAKPAPALLSPGMLSTIAPLPPTNIPPPPPPNSTVAQISQNMVSPSPAMAWENTTLLAQQQAQMIAQQNLLARQNQAQAQNEIMLMNQITQHNLAVLNQQNVGPISPTVTNANTMQTQMLKPQSYFSLAPHMLPPQHPFVLFPPRVAHLGLQRTQMAYPHLIHGSSPNMIPMMPHVAVKRSYGDAFTEQAAPAKRAYHTQGTVPVPYPAFYPNM